jgi:hypothetical protein
VAGRPCAREASIVRAAWSPDFASGRLDAELESHLAECETCAEIAALARALRDDRDAACAGASVPSAGAVWWRAQRRAREEAARRAARPISFVHGIALGTVAAAALAVFSLGLDDVRALLAGWSHAFSWPVFPTVTAVDLVSSLPASALLVLCTTLLLAPVAIYLAVKRADS